jgi:hypothetical protein
MKATTIHYAEGPSPKHAAACGRAVRAGTYSADLTKVTCGACKRTIGGGL